MKAFAIHFLLETKSGFRRKQQLFLNYFFPIGFFLMMGAVMPQLNPLFLEDMIPSMLIFAVMASTFLGIPEQIVNGRQSGVFRGYRVNGVPAVSLVCLPVLASVVHIFIVSAVILILSPLLFGAPSASNLITVFPLQLLTIFSCAGISVLVGTVASNSRTATMLSQVFFLPSMLIGGLMIPFEMLPEKLQPIARLLPSTHSMNLFGIYSWNRGASIASVTSLAVLFGAGLLCLILSVVFFRWDGSRKAED